MPGRHGQVAISKLTLMDMQLVMKSDVERMEWPRLIQGGLLLA
jgi:hypothetical protein